MSYQGIHSNGLPSRILDVLETDGGWLTTDGIAHQLEWNNVASVRRALERMTAKGVIEHRQVALAGHSAPPAKTYSGNGVGILDKRAEWRTT